MTFKEYMAQHYKERPDDRFSMVAWSVKHDQCFPNTKDYDEMLEYLKKVNASTTAIRSFKEAYLEYKHECPSRDGKVTIISFNDKVMNGLGITKELFEHEK
ncbi:YozE family protein [Rossellomorea oryzaecorticis]|uniref:YozE family protein n=1 Tax=Rossellomorea oryzaecorticis TaxID=1396505 RepID=A0ABU9KAC0_9BACI